MNQPIMDKAVVLARGLGTRMRKADDSVKMSVQETAAADLGVKAMMPIGRPFLDYVLQGLAEAGYRNVCLVIGPEHTAVRRYYTETLKSRRLHITFAIQKEPLGTADAVAAAEDFAGSDPVLVINSDNYYPVEALAALREIEGNGLAVFEREAMLAGSNIPADRIKKFAVVEVDAAGYLERIIEKPDEQALSRLADPICLSMNCWRFTPEIFQACRSITLSPRGELELPDAVQYCRDRLGRRFRVLNFQKPVLDLSCRADVPAIREKLAGTEVNL
jgi:glucose-1-phosphate thymidylyltransferase